tara:strand:+ start:3185 stop:3787 length:603 start_codon:yes stop_codon:yes gene_type:complete
MKTIQQGAEATILLDKDIVIKNRVPKGYRLPTLDNKIRKSRTKKETKLLEKASKIIPVPTVLNSSDKDKTIEMEFIDGKKLSESLDTMSNSLEVCKLIGSQLAALHNADIIHGDLTTSNLIFSDNKLYFIDFGLGFISNRKEHKATDLHLIKQALEAKHFSHFTQFFAAVLEGYSSSPDSLQVLKQLEKVELRGRYKQQY